MQNKKITVAATIAATTAAVGLTDEHDGFGSYDTSKHVSGHFNGSLADHAGYQPIDGRFGFQGGHGHHHVPEDTNSPIDHCELYGYSYECLERKVDETLGALADEVNNHGGEHAEAAENLRSECVTAMQELRSTLEGELAAAVESREATILAQTQAGVAAVDSARDEAIVALATEAEAIGVRVAAARADTEHAVEKLYASLDHGQYGSSAGGYGHGYGYAQFSDSHIPNGELNYNATSTHTVAEEIKRLVGEFDALIDAEGAAWEELVKTTQDAYEEIAGGEIQHLHEVAQSELEFWDQGAGVAVEHVTTIIQDKIVAMDELIAEATASIETMAGALGDNFVDRFWIQLEELNEHIAYHERQALVWKALHKKQEFLAALGHLREDLVHELSETRAHLVGELNVEREGFAYAVAEQRTGLVRFISACTENLAEAAGHGREALGLASMEGTENLDDLYVAEGKKLEEFLYALAKYAYRPHGYRPAQHAHKEQGQGYLPYVKHVVLDLQAQISAFGQGLLAEYDSASGTAMGAAESTLASEQAALHADNQAIQAALQAHTTAAIEHIIAAREELEVTLTEEQTAQEERDEAARDLLQVGLVATKNSLWKDISWLTRKQYSVGVNEYVDLHHVERANHHEDSDSEYNDLDDDHHEYHNEVTEGHVRKYAQVADKEKDEARKARHQRRRAHRNSRRPRKPSKNLVWNTYYKKRGYKFEREEESSESDHESHHSHSVDTVSEVSVESYSHHVDSEHSHSDSESSHHSHSESDHESDHHDDDHHKSENRYYKPHVKAAHKKHHTPHHQPGYGYSEINKKIEAMATAVDAAKAEHDALLEASYTELKNDLEAATAKYASDYIAEKEANFNAYVESKRELVIQLVADRTATVNAAIDAAEATIAELSAAKRDAMAARDKEIRWAITAVYEYHWQHKLIEALDAAVASMNATCDERELGFAASIAAARAAWSTTVETERASLDDFRIARDAECDAAQIDQTALFAAYVEGAKVRHAAWAAAESAALDAFIAECDEAWQWILKSYCLHDAGHHDTSDYAHYGHGCSHGQVYDKTVPIEEHDDVLEVKAVGAGLEIKNIADLEGRVQKSVDLTMEGVADLVSSLTASVDVAQAEIDASVEEERGFLESALQDQLDGLRSGLDALVQELIHQLADRDAEARADLSEGVDDSVVAINDLAEDILVKISELGWKLQQTYGYGGNESSHELKEMIVGEKEGFEHAIDDIYEYFDIKSEKEAEHHNEATDAAEASFEENVVAAKASMAEFIRVALEQFTDHLANAKTAFDGVLAEATGRLEALLAERLAWWDEQKGHELKHAKWTKDSYYRYHLLKLVQAKDESVHQALEAVRTEWTAHVGSEQIEAEAFRGEQLLIMSDFTEVVNSDLAKAIDGDREHLYTSNEGLWNEHDEFLNDEYDRLHYAIEDVSEHFRKELKKIYGFGGDVRSNYSATGTRADKGKNGTGYGSGQETHAPYTKHQHDQFLWKFKHYHGAQLAAMDASIENLWVFLDSRVVVRSGEAAVQANSLQNEITAEAKNIRDALLDTGDNLIQNKAEVAAIEHENLIEERIVVAAEANARADELRKEILYAVHVLRYAGGAGLHTVNHQLQSTPTQLTGVDELDLLHIPEGANFVEDHGEDPLIGGPTDYGFPDDVSSRPEEEHHEGFHSHGLTGIDALDLYSFNMDKYSHHGSYAQVQEPGAHPNYRDQHGPEDAHHTQLKQDIDTAKYAFNDMIQAARDEYRQSVDEVKQEIADLLDDTNNGERVPAGQAGAQELAELCEAAYSELGAGNDERSHAFSEAAEAHLVPVLEQIQKQIDNVNAWFGERLSWIESIADDYYREHLAHELTKKRDSALDDLQSKIDAAVDAVVSEQERLSYAQHDSLKELEEHCIGLQEDFLDFDNGEVDYVGETTKEIADEFDEAAEAEDDYLNFEELDELVRRWAWWLLKYYSYKGYDEFVYEGYSEHYDDDWFHHDEEEYGYPHNYDDDDHHDSDDDHHSHSDYDHSHSYSDDDHSHSDSDDDHSDDEYDHYGYNAHH